MSRLAPSRRASNARRNPSPFDLAMSSAVTQGAAAIDAQKKENTANTVNAIGQTVAGLFSNVWGTIQGNKLTAQQQAEQAAQLAALQAQQAQQGQQSSSWLPWVLGGVVVLGVVGTGGYLLMRKS